MPADILYMEACMDTQAQEQTQHSYDIEVHMHTISSSLPGNHNAGGDKQLLLVTKITRKDKSGET